MPGGDARLSIPQKNKRPGDYARRFVLKNCQSLS
jgi:hypothetical protein